MFGVKEGRSEAFEKREDESSTSIRATTANFNSASSSSPSTLPTLVPTKFSTLRPSCATAKAATKGTPTTPEHVFLSTTSLFAPSIIPADMASPLPLIETEEAEGDMTQVEEETDDTLHDLCAKVELKEWADSHAI